MEKLNLTQQKHIFSKKEMHYVKHNIDTKKLKPGLVRFSRI